MHVNRATGDYIYFQEQIHFFRCFFFFFCITVEFARPSCCISLTFTCTYACAAAKSRSILFLVAVQEERETFHVYRADIGEILLYVMGVSKVGRQCDQ